MSEPDRYTTCECCGVYFWAGGGAVFTGNRTNGAGDLVACYMCERCGTGQCDCDEQAEREEELKFYNYLPPLRDSY